MTSQFSPKVSEVLAFSREEATRLASRSVGPEHLLLGILRGRNAPIMDIFTRMDVNLQAVKAELEERVREDEINQPINTNDLVLNEKASNSLKLAVLEARSQHTQLVDVQHLLLAILHDQVDNGAKEVLEFNNMNYEDTITYMKATSSPTKDGLELPDEDYEEEEPGHRHMSQLFGLYPGSTINKSTPELFDAAKINDRTSSIVWRWPLRLEQGLDNQYVCKTWRGR